MRRLGVMDEWGAYPRRRVEADYLKVLYAWEITREGEPCVDGRHTVVHVDEQGRPAELPDAVRAALTG